ncbi:Aspartate ammonia-lyase [Corynebacterium faecale]|uniref:aspartate ammonia-lyase n=1 Tax=Corynebacterium faecale TaxID=1758466 RepID=UPI0025B3C7BE|nr:aspartate ammonia-lyase [Corynebacterium faecale]WJY92277.1 Aspartate ammonia-lyase [Corynebacterium faecale]
MSTKNNKDSEDTSKDNPQNPEQIEAPAAPLVDGEALVTTAETTATGEQTAAAKAATTRGKAARKFRIESDLIGEMEIPGEAYFGVHTLRAMDNFQISRTTINHVPEFIRGMVQVKKAAALANRRLHTLPADKAKAIVWACDQILIEGRCMDQFPIDVFQGGAGTSTNMNTNEVVANLALEYLGYEKGRYDILHPMDDVNMSQSTNDAYPTGFRLGIYASMTTLISEIDQLQVAFREKGTEFVDIIKMGRTQLQDAVPMSLGEEFQAFAANLAEEQSVLRSAMDRLLEVNLGATAIGTGVNTPSGYRHQVVASLSEVTSLEIKTARDLIEATSDTGAYVLAHSAVKRAAMKLSKISNDLRLLSSGPRAGFNEINLPARQAGSSIMPAKVNPVIPEVVNQVCFKVFGNDLTVAMAAEAGQLQLNVMEPVIGEALFQSIRILCNAAKTLREKCVVGITANADVCRAYVDNSIGIITYLNPFLGHDIGDEIGKEAAATGRSVRDLILERKLMDEETLNTVLSKENLMHPIFRGKLYLDQN